MTRAKIPQTITHRPSTERLCELFTLDENTREVLLNRADRASNAKAGAAAGGVYRG
jgi:hypothetical protein